jgi:hypothetical protein
MKTITAIVKPLSQAKSSDLRNLPAALERAFLRAQALAKQTDTYLIVQRDGELVKLKVN